MDQAHLIAVILQKQEMKSHGFTMKGNEKDLELLLRLMEEVYFDFKKQCFHCFIFLKERGDLSKLAAPLQGTIGKFLNIDMVVQGTFCWSANIPMASSDRKMVYFQPATIIAVNKGVDIHLARELYRKKKLSTSTIESIFKVGRKEIVVGLLKELNPEAYFVTDRLLAGLNCRQWLPIIIGCEVHPADHSWSHIFMEGSYSSKKTIPGVSCLFDSDLRSSKTSRSLAIVKDGNIIAGEGSKCIKVDLGNIFICDGSCQGQPRAGILSPLLRRLNDDEAKFIEFLEEEVTETIKSPCLQHTSITTQSENNSMFLLVIRGIASLHVVTRDTLQEISCTDGGRKILAVGKCYARMTRLIVHYGHHAIMALGMDVNQDMTTFRLFPLLQLVIETGTGLWDPGGEHYTATTFPTFFKIWDPGGSLFRGVMFRSSPHHLEDKVILEGGGIVRDLLFSRHPKSIPVARKKGIGLTSAHFRRNSKLKVC